MYSMEEKKGRKVAICVKNITKNKRICKQLFFHSLFFYCLNEKSGDFFIYGRRDE